MQLGCEQVDMSDLEGAIELVMQGAQRDAVASVDSSAYNAGPLEISSAMKRNVWFTLGIVAAMAVALLL